MLIVTADDYGMTRRATDSILTAFRHERITSTCAMVFMEDSMRAASLALDARFEVGLHLNFTLPFSADDVAADLRMHQKRVVAYLSHGKLSQLLYNPLLARSFEELFSWQQKEFIRLYRRSPDYYNGHHHMHLCANMLVQRLIPAGARVRSTFTFEPGERSSANLLYRRILHSWVAKRHRTTDGLFNLVPIRDRARLHRIVRRADTQTIELEVHPEVAEECEFILSDEYQDLMKGIRKGAFRDLKY